MSRRIYSGKDFATLVAEVKSRLRRKFPDVQFDFTNDMQVVIMEVVAFASENVNFFQDLQASEGYMETAQLSSSVAKISSTNAYNPPGAVPAAGSLQVSLAEALTRTVQILVGQGWTATNGLRYESTEEVLFAPSEVGPKEVPLAQIETRTQVFRSDASRFQRFSLDRRAGEFIAYRSVEIGVDGETWEERDAFLDTDTDVFKVAYTGDPPFIEFGDGAVATIPPDGAEIVVTYKVTRGIAGILPNGNITAANPQIVAGGEAVAIVLDEESGAMSGGLGPESPVISKSKIPLAAHADNAVVVHDDFSGLVTRFRDPVHGAVGAATAVLATSIDNDLVGSLLLSQMRSLFVDADAIIDAVAASLRQTRTNIDGHLDTIDTTAANVVLLAAAAGAIIADLVSIRAEKDLATASLNLASDDLDTVDSSSDSAASSITTAETESASLRADIDPGIATGGSDSLTAATKAALLARLDTIDALLVEARIRTEAGGSIQSSTASAQASLSAVKARLSTIETITENTESLSGDVEADGLAIQAEVVLAKVDTAAIEVDVLVLETALVDPWDDALTKLDELEAHYDALLADECGPNLISVPILTRDVDGFLVAPSIGLIRSVEAFITARKEPSVVFEVSDGSEFLVIPTMEVVFEPLVGEVPIKIKAAYESALLTLIKTQDFGGALFLADQYNQLRPIGQVKSVNVEIQSFSARTNSASVIDGEGNLIVGEREVVGRPVINYLRKFPDGTKEPI